MRLIKVNDGKTISWHSNTASAKEASPRKPEWRQEVEVPTNKEGLIEFLNKNASKL